MEEKAELVFIPSPGMPGHLISAVEMAHLLLGRDHRLSITVLNMNISLDSKITSIIESVLSSSDSSDDRRLRFIDVPQDAVAAEHAKSHNFLEFVESQKPAVRQVVSQMISGSARLAGFIVDIFCTDMIEVAKEFGLPSYIFYTSGAGSLGLMFYLQALQDDENRDVTEFKDSDTELPVPVFANPFPTKALPTMAMDKNGESDKFLSFARKFRESEGIMINTFTELEGHAIKALSDDDKIPPVYPVGPVLNLKGNGGDAQESEEILGWLDEQPPASVVFLCFGSLGYFHREQVREIALALEHGGRRFLWSLRRPTRRAKEGENGDPLLLLPEGFLERTAGKGKMIGWAPQVAVLSHPAVGGFVTHCGWNSILESLWCGVPMAAWPLYAEQQVNAFQLVVDLGIAAEIKLDYKQDWTGERQEIVAAEEIERGIREVMDGVGQSRERVKEMSEKARVAVLPGGSSFSSIGRFIDYVLHDKGTPRS